MKVKKINKSLIIEQIIKDAKKNIHVKPTIPQKSSALKNIIELTEQNDNNQVANLSNDDVSTTTTNGSAFQQQNRFSCFGRYLKCIVNSWNFFVKTHKKMQIDIEETDLSKIVEKIKKKIQNGKSILPPQTEKKKVLVLDLDETLIHTSFSKPAKYDYELQIIFNGRATKIYTVKRFGLDAFLFEMSKLYEIVMYTASQKSYADKVVDLIDPKGRISHRLYRQHCIIVNKLYYIKDINHLGRNLKNIIIVDDNNLAGMLQPNNFYKINSFQGNQRDRDLFRLSAFLKYAYHKKDITSIKDEKSLFQNQQIIVLDEDSILTNDQKSVQLHDLKKTKTSGDEQGQKRNSIQRKRKYGHKKKNSEVEALIFENMQQVDGQVQQNTANQLIKKL